MADRTDFVNFGGVLAAAFTYLASLEVGAYFGAEGASRVEKLADFVESGEVPFQTTMMH